MSKRVAVLLLALVCFALVGAMQCFAQEAGQSAQEAAGSASQAASGMAPDAATKAQIQERLQKLSAELNLTDDQKEKIKPILQGEFQQLKSVHDDSSMSSDQKQAKMKEVHQSAKSQINSILTPEQQQKLQSMKEEAAKEY